MWRILLHNSQMSIPLGWDGCKSFVIGLLGECLGAAMMTVAPYGLVVGLGRFWMRVMVRGLHDITQSTSLVAKSIEAQVTVYKQVRLCSQVR